MSYLRAKTLPSFFPPSYLCKLFWVLFLFFNKSIIYVDKISKNYIWKLGTFIESLNKPHQRL